MGSIDFGDAIQEWLGTQQDLEKLRICCGGMRSAAFCFKEGINVHIAQVSLDGTVWAARHKTAINVADPEFFNKLHEFLASLLVEEKPYYVNHPR